MPHFFIFICCHFIVFICLIPLYLLQPLRLWCLSFATAYSLLQNFAARNLESCFVFRRFRLAMLLVAGAFLLANNKSAYEPI